MTLQELLLSRGITLEKTKLMRHSIAAYQHFYDYFDFYQALQRRGRLKNCEYFLSFLSDRGTSAKYYGCYKVTGYEPLTKESLPQDYPIGDFELEAARAVLYSIEKLDILADMENRLVIDWGKSTRNWLQNATTEKEVLYILPNISEYEFISYDKVILHFDSLKHIIRNRKEHKIWEDRLSAVAGVYLITDTKTGKHYVGSASSNDNGIWGRWSDYAKTGHGGNKRLIELINNDENYCKNFIFSILEVFPIKRDRSEILEYEQLYKNKLRTIQFGLNVN
jgi:hypothetical protein